MRAFAWCLRATGKSLLVLAYLMLFHLTENDYEPLALTLLTASFILGGAKLLYEGERLQKGDEALAAMNA